MADTQKHWVVYQCSWCGMTQTRSTGQGRPYPGSCLRRPKMRNGQSMPHRWTISKRF